MSHLVFPIVCAIGLLVFAGILAGRARLLVAARPAGRLDHIGARLKRMTVDGIGQRKFMSGEQPAGIMHALVFWGFLVLMIQVVTLFGRALDATWDIPGFGPDQLLGPPFFIARDLLELVVIVGVGYMLWRRLIVHMPRLIGLGRAEQRFRESPHWEAILILVFIELIMIGGLLYDAGHLVAFDIGGNERDYSPVTALAAAGLGGLSRSAAQTVSQVGWWMHCVTILVFLNLLPLSKHFHIITALPNVFFGKLPPRAVERPLAITQVPAAPVAALDGPPEGRTGVASLADLNWKQVMDAFTCTECGRCTAVCPAPHPHARAGRYHHDRRPPGPGPPPTTARGRPQRGDVGAALGVGPARVAEVGGRRRGRSASSPRGCAARSGAPLSHGAPPRPSRGARRSPRSSPRARELEGTPARTSRPTPRARSSRASSAAAGRVRPGRRGCGATVGRLAGELPPDHEPQNTPTTFVPRLIELCFQTAGVWEIGTEGRMALPTGLVRVTRYAGADDPGRLFAVVTPRPDGAGTDADVVDEDGRVRVRLEGYRTIELPGALDPDALAPIRAAMGTS